MRVVGSAEPCGTAWWINDRGAVEIIPGAGAGDDTVVVSREREVLLARMILACDEALREMEGAQS